MVVPRRSTPSESDQTKLPLAEALAAYLDLPLTTARIRRFSAREVCGEIQLHLVRLASRGEEGVHPFRGRGMCQCLVEEVRLPWGSNLTGDCPQKTRRLLVWAECKESS